VLFENAGNKNIEMEILIILLIMSVSAFCVKTDTVAVIKQPAVFSSQSEIDPKLKMIAQNL
jgi:hypothetical protein